MRENMGLYRGKIKNGTRWVVGPLLFVEEEPAIYDTTDPESTSVWMYGEAHLWGAVPVIPETVGQCIGLTDKNGKNIFEGDIIHYHESDKVYVGIIRFEGYSQSIGLHLGFNVEWVSPDAVNFRQDIRFWAICREISVVGTIHDNPELLKEVAQ